MNIKMPANISDSANGYTHEAPDEIGEWTVVKTLQAQYHGQAVAKTYDEERQTECLFQDAEWDYSKAHGDWLKAKFTTIFPSNHSAPALELAVRIIGHHLSKGYSKKEYSAKTIGGTLTDGKDFINWLIEKNILVGTSGEYLVPSNRLLTSDFNSFFDQIGTFSLTGFLGKTRLISIWHEMSKANRLPSFMSLPLDPFQGQSTKGAWDSRAHLRAKGDADEIDEENEEGAWAAIPLNYAFKMVSEALKVVIDRHREIIDTYEVFRQADSLGGSNDRGKSLQRLLAAKPEIKDKVPSTCFVDDKFTTFQPIQDLLREAQDAAIIIILSTTGLRNWEVRELKVGCCKPDKVMRGAFRLNACIKKTSRERGKGKMVSLPIPEATAQAITLLETMRIHDCEYLIKPYTTKNKKKRSSTHYINVRVAAFCDDKNIGYSPHPHQFRKTIAGWFGLHSKYATLLVMRLFSHESAAMANRYLFNNPLIKEARQDVLKEAMRSLIGPLKEALIDGKLKGPMGEQICTAIAEHPHFKGLTGVDLAQTLEKLIVERVESEQAYLMLTPLAVCTTNTNSNELPPCATTECGDSSCSIDDQIQRFNQATPNPEKCLGAGCKRAIVTPLNKGGLTQNLLFYKSVLSDGKAEFADNIVLMDKARTFVHNHEELVAEL